MNTLAVLLIIGGAVVGPIEAQQLTPYSVEFPPGISECRWTTSFCDSIQTKLARGGTSNRCVRDQKYLTGLPDCVEISATYESLPELCERAMREVGAAKWYRYSKNSKYPNGLITYELAKDLPAGTPPPEVKWTLPQTAYEKIEQTAMAKYFQTQPGFSPEFSFGTTYWNGPEVRCIPVPTGYKR